MTSQEKTDDLSIENLLDDARANIDQALAAGADPETVQDQLSQIPGLAVEPAYDQDICDKEIRVLGRLLKVESKELQEAKVARVASKMREFTHVEPDLDALARRLSYMQRRRHFGR